MKPLTKDELARKALAYGGTAQVGGATINASRATVTKLPVKPVQKLPDPAPVAPPVPVLPKIEVQPAVNNITVDTEQIANAVRFAMGDLHRAIVDRPNPVPVKSTGWVFDIEYNAQGRLMRIIANPKG